MTFAQNTSTSKRKAIDDFFTPLKKKLPLSKNITSAHGEGNNKDLLATLPRTISTAVPGLSLILDYVSQAEERDILAFLDDSTKCTWRTDLSRRTMHFGGTYCIMPRRNVTSDPSKAEILQAPNLPPELNWLVQRFLDTSVYSHEQRPQYCIVNEYAGALGISAHTENFQFGEPVVGLSLLSASAIRFHEMVGAYDGSVRSGKAAQAQKTGKVLDIQLPSRSLLVMNGPSRWSWQHEIVRSAKGRGPNWKRVSLTFRFKPA
ncbi:MAG: hypothetical protein L6R41_005749 [Letrouitia leprolyta]|nr:MAG: hypothetical protein L6R41_005749 [Letrouitia leprolyta]